MTIQKILIANRGEIACRVIETARKMGVATVAVYSDPDKKARHVRLADEAVALGGQTATESYLKSDLILEIAKDTGADAIHPGYGFLSENADFADLCEKNDVIFIGPPSSAIRAMGLKDEAKDLMIKADVPVVPGYQGENQDPEFLKAEADKIGYPVLIKAVAGGGGKGMRLVESETDFLEMLKSCQREAKASFANDHVLIEKYITKPRHVEVQVFGDKHGNVVHLFERDCSLQRRHQKVVEEAPAPGITEQTRTALGQSAVDAAKSIQYNNAGTIEFIMDVSNGVENAPFYFMEMNTRLQVEHPVTEKITGYDLVEWQIRVASGEELPATQDEIEINGHSFEVRLYAEDASRDFVPQIGKVNHFMHPSNTHSVRVDTGIESGDEVSIHYDPMVAKLITWGESRDEAIRIMSETLGTTAISGLITNQEFLQNIFKHDDFKSGDVDTGFIPRHSDKLIPDNYAKADDIDIALASVHVALGLHENTFVAERKVKNPWTDHINWRISGNANRHLIWVQGGERVEAHITGSDDEYIVTVNGTEHSVKLLSHSTVTTAAIVNDENVRAKFLVFGPDYTLLRGGRIINMHRFMAGIDDEGQAGDGRIVAGMPGRIVDVLVQAGDNVTKDQPILIMEAMKMEMTIRADCDGVIDELPVSANDQVVDGALLISIKSKDAA